VVAGLAYQGRCSIPIGPGLQDSTRVIAERTSGLVFRTGILCQPERRSEELRKAYVAHVQKMFELSGITRDGGRGSEGSDADRTELARGSMTRVERREPKRLYHKMTVKELEKLSPQFDWSAYFTRPACLR